MGKLILRKNGIETQIINGVDVSTFTPEANTYILGFDPVSGNLESLGPDGDVTQYGSGSSNSNFTGGTVTGPTNFTNTVTTNVFSANTYLNLPSNSNFTGGTVTGPTNFTNGLTGNTIYSNAFIGDGSQLGGVVGLTYSQLGFTITSPTPSSINQNVVLPYNSTVTYPTPLNVGTGYTISIPEGTTLTII